MNTRAHSGPGNGRQPGLRARRAGRWIVPACLCAVTILALGLRAHARFSQGVLFFGDPRSSVPGSDAMTWNVHALNWMSGRGFGDVIRGVRHENFVPPGHPLLLAAIYHFAGNRPDIAGWVLAGLGALLPLVTYRLVRDLWGRGPGLIAALLATAYRPYVTLGYSTMSESTAIFFAAAALGQWARMVRRPAFARALLAGCLFALAGLVRPVAFSFLAGLLPFMAILRPVSPRRRWVCSALLLLPSLLAAGGWAARNRVTLRHPDAAFTWNSAIHRWIGAHPEYGPFFYSRPSWHAAIWRDPAASEGEMQARLRRESAEFIRADPLRWGFGALWRFGLMNWRPHEKPLPLHVSSRGFAGISILFVIGAFGWLQGFRLRTVQRHPDGTSRIPGRFWCGALGAAFLLGLVSTALFGGSERYRWPLDYLLLPFVALALDRLLRIGRDDFASPATLRCAVPAWPPAARAAGIVLAGLFVALGLVFNVGLARAYAHPDRSAENAPRIPVTDVRQTLEQTGLAAEWETQRPRWPTFSDVHAEQAVNGGYVTSLANAVAVWWGRILYVQPLKHGQTAVELVERPRAGDFGGARVEVILGRETRLPADELRPGQIVTVVGRLAYIHEDEPRPRLHARAVLRGRFDPPPEDAAPPASAPRAP